MRIENQAFEFTVSAYYQDLYRFAYSLCRNEADAADLTQETFCRYASKGDQIRDHSKTKSWLFQTLKHEFLNQARRRKRFEHVELETVLHELPQEESLPGQAIDSQLAVDALQKVDENYRLALSLFYMSQLSYREIADTLEVPIGTVMSRLSRGKAQLKSLLAQAMSESPH